MTATEPRLVIPEPPVYPNLATALSAFQADLPQVSKGNTARIPGKDGKQGYSYEYADLTDVSAAVLPALARVGLAWVTMVNAEEDQIVLTWMLTHGPSGEALEGSVPVGRKGQNWQDLGGSITYARRYCLVAVTGVAPGGDDNDGAGATAGQQQREQRPAAAPIAPPAKEYLPAGLYDLGALTTLAEVQAMFYQARDAKHLNLVVQNIDGTEVLFGKWLQDLGNDLKDAETDAKEADAEEAERRAIALHEAELAAAEAAAQAEARDDDSAGDRG